MITKLAKQQGYSLIEVMVAVSLLAIISLASVNLFFRTTVGSTRDNTTRLLKQNGDFAVAQIESSFRAAVALHPNTPCQTNMNSGVTLITQSPNPEVWTFGTSSNPAILLNNSSLISSNIRVSNLQVSCRRDAASNVAFISIGFNLSRGGGTADLRQETATQRFQTSVTLRNR